MNFGYPLKITVLVVLLSQLVLACNRSTVTPVATNTPVPPIDTPHISTDTPVPTFTDTPTASPTTAPTVTGTPKPTETPTQTLDLRATAAYESTQEAESMLVEIGEVLEEIHHSTDEGYLAWSERDPWPISSSSYASIVYEPIDEGTDYKTYVLHYDVTWESTSGLAGCGLIFHSEKKLASGKQYRFFAYRFSGLPYWTVELWNANSPPMPAMGRGKVNGAINQDNGSTNSYTLVVREDILTIYANNKRLSHVPISSLYKGRIAFFVFQESGETTCSFKNAWLWSLEESEE